jgi:very-short-patch-repair endonuclease
VDVPLARLLRRQDNVITRWQALCHLSVKALRHLVESGRWRRLQDGLFIAQTGRLTSTQCEWAAVLGAGGDRLPTQVCLGGLNALRSWGLSSIEPNGIHVLVPARRQLNPRPGVFVHRSRVPPDLDGCQHLRPPASLPGRSLVDAVQWARSDQEARLFVAASFQQGVVTLADVRRALAEMPNAARGAVLRRTAEDCAGGSHSLAELELLALCQRFRLPEPTRQSVRLDRQGRRRYLDAVFDPWLVAIEIDGAHHLDVARIWDDAQRNNSLVLDGFTVLRYPAFALQTRAAQIAAEIKEALRRAGWPEGAV